MHALVCQNNVILLDPWIHCLNRFFKTLCFCYLMGQVGLQYVRCCTHFPLYRASLVNV